MKFTTKNRAGIISGIVATVLLSCAGPCFAQNVADAAKLERERKEREFARRRIRRGGTGGWDQADRQAPEAIASELSHPM